LNTNENEVFMKTIMPEPERILIAVLKKDGQKVDQSLFSGLTQETWDEIFAVSARQRVSSLFWRRLNQMGLADVVPTQTAEKFQNRLRRNTMHNLRFCADLQCLLSALKSEGIPLILLKGIFLANTVYTNIGLREMNDIDVLARPSDLARIAGILADRGYTSVLPICVDITINADHHLPRMVRHGHASFEIHWNLTNPGTYYSIDPDGLWERAVPVHIAGCDALALSPEDLLLHLCLHTSYQHQFAFGLRPFCDIAETIAHSGPALSWQIIIEQATLRSWQRGICLSLLLARELAGASVPTDILEGLRPGDMTEAVLEAARAHVLTKKGFTGEIPAALAELLESRRLWGKILIFWQRVFLPRDLIAAQFLVPADSLKIYGCYVRRFIDVLRRYGHTLKSYRQNDVPLKIFVERTSRIANWLAGPAIHR
jgi:hypothetical protein